MQHLESIVIDGGSSDETIDVLDDYREQIDVFVSEPDGGAYDAMNKGIVRASGDVVGILNADDYYSDPSVLRDVLDRLVESGADTCYGDLVYVNRNDDVIRYWQSGPYRPIRFHLGWIPPHPTFFVKRSLYERYGTYDLDLPISADYELMLRLLLNRGVSTTYIDRVLVRMAVGGQSNESLSNIIQGNREVFRAWKKNGLRGGYLAPFFKPLRKLPQFVGTRLGSMKLNDFDVS